MKNMNMSICWERKLGSERPLNAFIYPAKGVSSRMALEQEPTGTTLLKGN